MELFILGKDFLVELDKEWISTVKEFKVILLRDKGTKGDTQARKKLQAQKEFTFIYNYCDYRSKFINFSEKDRLKYALKNAELPEDLDIFKDRELADAIEVYKTLQLTPSLKLLKSLKEGMHTGHRVVDRIIYYLNKKLDEIEADPDSLKEVVKNVGGKNVIVDPIREIEQKLDTIMDISNKLPRTLKSISELEDEVTKELADAPNLRGKAIKGAREDAPANFNPGALNPFAPK